MRYLSACSGIEAASVARGNLSLAYVRAIHAIDPLWSLTENVPGWLSTTDNAFGCVLAGLVGADAALMSPLERGRWPRAGVVTGPERTAAWRVLDAQYFGLAQRRARVFVLSVRGAGNWACASALFPVGQSLSGHPAPRREAGERVAPSVTVGPPFSRTGNERVEAEALIAPTIPSRSTAGGGLGTDFDCDDGLIPAFGERERALTGSNQRIDAETETFVVHSLRADGFDALEDGTGRGTPIVPIQCNGTNVGTDLPSLRRGDGGLQVRRLTARECCRLQGFPDDYLDILYRGKPAADGPKYKALGNSFAVPVVRWIGQRIAFVAEVTAELEQQEQSA